jgi:hypothetical protein
MCSNGVLRELLNGYTVLSQVGRWVKVSGVVTATGQWYRGRERQEKKRQEKNVRKKRAPLKKNTKKKPRK